MQQICRQASYFQNNKYAKKFADRLATCKIRNAASVLKRKNSSKVEKYETKVVGNSSSYFPIIFILNLNNDKKVNLDFDTFFK